jgi:predicted amino acid-binding ACT domain protein
MTVDSYGIFAYYERDSTRGGLSIPLFHTLAEVHKSMKEEDLFVITVVGEDRVGLVASVTSLLFKAGLNIVDIEQSVIHSQFTMVCLVQPLKPTFDIVQLRQDLKGIGRDFDLNIAVMPLKEFKGLRLAEEKVPYVLTILGSDRPGVVAGISRVLAEGPANIEKIKMIARGEFLAMEMLVDIRGGNFVPLRKRLLEVADTFKEEASGGGRRDRNGHHSPAGKDVQETEEDNRIRYGFHHR